MQAWTLRVPEGTFLTAQLSVCVCVCVCVCVVGGTGEGVGIKITSFEFENLYLLFGASLVAQLV